MTEAGLAWTYPGDGGGRVGQHPVWEVDPWGGRWTHEVVTSEIIVIQNGKVIVITMCGVKWVLDLSR